ncbi:hypothetical protein BH10ACI2_BH10ACI2_11300 [soil metagenome]
MLIIEANMSNDGENSADITRFLREWGDGDRDALDRLMPIVYDELRRQAARFLRRESQAPYKRPHLSTRRI